MHRHLPLLSSTVVTCTDIYRKKHTWSVDEKFDIVGLIGGIFSAASVISSA